MLVCVTDNKEEGQLTDTHAVTSLSFGTVALLCRQGQRSGSCLSAI